MTPSYPVIDRYLDELSAMLPASAGPGERAIAEIRDHVLCEFEARLAEGHNAAAAADRAVECVGDARTVAAAFVETTTRRAIARAERLSTVSVFAIGVIALFANRFAIVPGTVTAALAGVVGWFAAQLAAVALVVAWLRSQRLRTLPRAGAGTIGLSLRALSVAVGAAVVAVGFDVAAALGAGERLRPQSAVGLGLAVIGTAAAASCLGRATRRTHQLRGLDAAETAGASALEELRWTARRIVAPIGKWRGRRTSVAMSVVDRAVSWALSHRAGAAGIAAMGAGSAPALASLREHGLGGNPHQNLLSVAAAAVQFAVEGAAVVAAVYLFDRVLRLWPTGSRNLPAGSDNAPAQ